MASSNPGVAPRLAERNAKPNKEPETNHYRGYDLSTRDPHQDLPCSERNRNGPAGLGSVTHRGWVTRSLRRDRAQQRPEPP